MSRLCLGLCVLASSSIVAGLPATAHAAPPEVPSTEAIFGTVKDLVDIGPRRTGTPEGKAAADYVQRRLEAYGITTHQEHTTSYAWDPQRWGLKVEGETIDAFPSWHSFTAEPGWTGHFSTGPGGRTAELVDVGDGGALDIARRNVRGKIAVFNLRFQVPLAGMAMASSFIYDPRLTLLRDPVALKQGNPFMTNYNETVKQLRDGGAAGFIGVLTDYFDSNEYLNEYHGRARASMPGVWVTRAQGARIRGLARAGGGKATATITLEGRRAEAQTNTVVGILPGQSTDTIMIQSHHDSLSPGAVEDASGTAEVIALAEAFAALPLSERKKTLMFTTFDSHFTGYHAHGAFRDKWLRSGTAPLKIVGNVTIEHIGLQGVTRQGKLTMSTLPEPRGVFAIGSYRLKRSVERAIVRNRLERTAILTVDNLGMPTDASFLTAKPENGIPVVSFISGPSYLYDMADTLDKVAVKELRPVAKAFTEVVDGMDDMTPLQMRRGR